FTSLMPAITNVLPFCTFIHGGNVDVTFVQKRHWAQGHWPPHAVAQNDAPGEGLAPHEDVALAGAVHRPYHHGRLTPGEELRLDPDAMGALAVAGHGKRIVQLDAESPIGIYNGPTKLDTKTARFKLHLRAWDGFGSSTHQVSRQRLFWNCSKKRVAYRSCRRSMGSILRNFTGGARRRWKSCRRFSPENPVGKKRRPVTMNASTSSTPKLEGSAPSWIGLKKRAFTLSRDERLQLIDWDRRDLSLATQAELLGLNRSGLYYKPKPPSEEELALKRAIDEIYTEHPYYGSRRITAALRRQGFVVNRKAVQRHMREMGLEAVYPGPNLSRRSQQHRVYPYLLRGMVITAPNQVW